MSDLKLTRDLLARGGTHGALAKRLRAGDAALRIDMPLEDVAAQLESAN